MHRAKIEREERRLRQLTASLFDETRNPVADNEAAARGIGTV